MSFLSFKGLVCVDSSDRPPSVSRGGSSSSAVRLSEKVMLGGVEQFITIRGSSCKHPILLFIHGGPGLPSTAFSGWDSALENQYLIVHWDQRGTGKSYSLFSGPAQFGLEQFVSDAKELALYLIGTFGKERIVVLGHSWGSMIGALVVSRFPELFSAYIGIGQVANLKASQEVAYEEAASNAEAYNLVDATVGLQILGPPPYTSDEQSDALERIAQRVAARNYRPATRSVFWRHAFKYSAYSCVDLAMIPLGVRLATRRLWSEIVGFDLFKVVTRIDVPVFIILGKHDVVVSQRVTQKFYHQLIAPRGKTFISIDHAGHWPQFEQTAKLCEILSDRVRIAA